MALWVVDVREVNPPAGQEPVHWRLLTTIAVGNADATTKGMVFQLNWTLGVQVNSVGLGHDHDWTLLCPLSIQVSLIQVVNCAQTLNLCLFDTSHAEIGMERFLEAERSCPSIPCHQLQVQLGTKRGAMDEMEVSGPPSLRNVIAFGEHGDRNCIPGLHDRLKLPRRRAHQSVRRSAGIVFFVSKPGKADGYSATNGVTVLPA